jgi:hypothetical protein
MRVSFLWCLALGLLLLAGCGQPWVSLREGPREYVAMDYDHVLTEWTRTEHLITLAALDDVLTVTATFESWDFRWAYVVRYAHDYQLSIEQRRTLLETTLADTRQHHQFFVALYGPNRKWTDLTKATSAWIVRLVDDQGHETAPEEIVPISKPGPIERTYFPYASVWRQAYRFKFPVSTAQGPTVAPDAKWFGLQFSGVQGSQQVVWHLDSERQRHAALSP